MKSAYQELLEKLDAYINRYYLNQVIRGLLLFLSWGLGLWLLISGTAFYMELNSAGRTVLFFGFAGVSAYLLISWILVPLFRIQGWLPRMSYQAAAVRVGNHFADVRDKLLNTIELANFKEEGISRDLLLASIEQRTLALRPIPFFKGINLKDNRKYLRWLVPVAGVFGLILLFAPAVITEGGARILKYNQEFDPFRPFDFVFDETAWATEQGSDLNIAVGLVGKELPKEVQIEVGGFQYRMDAKGKNAFVYALKNVRKDLKIKFIANKFKSTTYTIKVVPKPVIDRFEVKLNYPAYLGKSSEILTNTGDLLVPEGTQIQWNFKGSSIDDLSLFLNSNENLIQPTAKRAGNFEVRWRAMESLMYGVHIRNKKNPKSDTLNFGIRVIPDLWPEILVSESRDSVQRQLRYFTGEISDDYGFTDLWFAYTLQDAEGKPLGKEVKVPLVLGSGVRQRFYHYFDLSTLDLRDGSAVNYCFEIADNDGVKGPKKVRTQSFVYRSLTAEESKEQIDKNTSEVEKQLRESIKDIKQIQRDAEKLNKKLKEGKELGWEDKKLLEQLQQKQQQLQQKLESSKEQLKENEQLRDSKKQDESLREKQQKLQEMAEKLLTDDLKKMMEELNKMMEKAANKDQLQQQLDNMKLDQKEVERELDRMLEFFKGMEVEQRMNEAANELEKLAKKQQELQQDNKSSAEELSAKQQELNKQFEQLKEDLNKLDDLNNDLQRPNDLGDLNKEANEVKDNMDQAKSELQKNKQSQAKQQQQKASKQMQQMAQKMRDQMQQQDMQQLDENIQSLRMILENLVKFSFGQERLMDRLQENSNYSPVYVEIGKDQSKLREEARLIEDSLVALGKRIMQLQSSITKDMAQVNDNLQKAVEHLGARQTPQAKARQQYAMTGVNNLALLLSELLNSLQEEKAQKMDGDQQCQKPGGGSQSKMSKLSQMQQSLNQQMKQMKERMKGENGKPNEGKQGKNSEMSKGFAEMVAKQEAIRRELQKLSQEMGREGQGGQKGELEKLAKEMEKTERELVNKILSSDALKRQEEILTRMLESDKADKQREFEDQREGTTANDNQRSSPPGFEVFKKQQRKSLDMYQTVAPELNSYYKRKVERYFLELNP
ncbi:MAG: hypothetical protein C0424_01715 [Sphingobacteriaceae bacterium]|nr:hypothetical protein [Sphingobacteriaceae bacterium]